MASALALALRVAISFCCSSALCIANAVLAMRYFRRAAAIRVWVSFNANMAFFITGAVVISSFIGNPSSRNMPPSRSVTSELDALAAFSTSTTFMATETDRSRSRSATSHP